MQMEYAGVFTCCAALLRAEHLSMSVIALFWAGIRRVTMAAGELFFGNWEYFDTRTIPTATQALFEIITMLEILLVAEEGLEPPTRGL